MADQHSPDGPQARALWLGRWLSGPAMLRRALTWCRSHPAMAGGAAVATLAAGIGTFWLLSSLFPSSPVAVGSVDEALALLDAGKFASAREMAAQLRSGDDLSYEQRGALLFVLGSTVAADAGVHTNPQEQQVLYLVASRYLEESRLCGFPTGQEARGMKLLGTCLVHAGRPEEAIAILKAAVRANPDSQAELYRLLTRAALESDPPQPKQALDFNRRYLAARGLSAPERELGLIAQGEIHLALKDADAGREALAKIPEGSRAFPQAVLLLVRMILIEADQLAADPQAAGTVQEALTGAIASLEEVVATPRIDSELKTHAQLLAAICYARLDEHGRAITLFVKIRRASHGSPAAFAAAVFESELHLVSSRSEEALQLLARALADATAAVIDRNPWLPKAELTGRLEAAFRRFVDGGDFSRAVELARALPPLLDPTLSYQWRAQAQHAWARQLEAQAALQPLAMAEALRSEARTHFRQAGADFERLAELRFRTRHYLDDLSHSAADYLAGHGYSQAARTFRLYLKSDPQEGRAEALNGLGEALLAIGQTGAAATALDQCRELFPKHPASYRARYLGSLAQRELGNMAQAQKLLVDNLYNYSLSPDSAEWRDSLFLLGKLRYLEGVAAETSSRVAGVSAAPANARSPGSLELEKSHEAFQAAIALLDEAIRRYPQAAQAIEARYELAESHRHAAKWPRHRLDLITIDASKAPLVKQMHEELDAAALEYGALIEQLGDDREGKGQSRLAQTILRNSYFGRADALFDIGRYEEAAEAYSAATNRYQNEPEALSAYVQIAACYRRQDRLSEARGTLEQARLVLARIRQDADFKRTTPYSRDEWSNLLTWLAAL